MSFSGKILLLTKLLIILSSAGCAKYEKPAQDRLLCDAEIAPEHNIDNFLSKANDGDLNSIVAVAKYYLARGDVKNYQFWLVKAADKGCDSASYQLGSLYLVMTGADENTRKLGEDLMSSSYEQGFFKASLLLGFYFNSEENARYDVVKAKYWFERAVYHGYTDAIQHLIVLYLDHPKNDSEYSKAYALSLLFSSRVPPFSPLWVKNNDWRNSAAERLSKNDIRLATDYFLDMLWRLPCAPDNDESYCLEIRTNHDLNRLNGTSKLDAWRESE